MPDTDSAALPSARINVSTTSGLAALDAEVAAAERQERERYKLALVAMIEQAFTLDELEGLLYKAQWILERSAADKETAARAVIAECTRIIENRERFLRTYPTCSDFDRNECNRSITIARDTMNRWKKRILPRGRA